VTDRSAIVAAIETYCRAETEKDKAVWMGLFTEDVVHEDPVGVSTNRGLKALDAFWDVIVGSDVDLELVEEVIVCGHEAVAIMRCEVGPPDARVRVGPIVDHFTFDAAGKITQVRAFYAYD
jgi:hypothetical protein